MVRANLTTPSPITLRTRAASTPSRSSPGKSLGATTRWAIQRKEQTDALGQEFLNHWPQMQSSATRLDGSPQNKGETLRLTHDLDGEPRRKPKASDQVVISRTELR